jgi:hypothetical protein
LKIAESRNLLFCGGADVTVSRRKDGHANTPTVSLAANRNIFGGVTPVDWESSRKGKRKRDPDAPFAKLDASQKSFLFTLNNPHNIPARRFALKDQAIW